MSDFKGCGWSREHRPDLGTVEVYKHPARKSIALAIGHGAQSHVVAYFRSEEDATEFMDFMGKFMGVQQEEEA